MPKAGKTVRMCVSRVNQVRPQISFGGETIMDTLCAAFRFARFPCPTGSASCSGTRTLKFSSGAAGSHFISRNTVLPAPSAGRGWFGVCCDSNHVLPIQSRQELPDGPEVIRRVSGRGEGGGSAQVVPIRAAGDDLSPLFGFVAQTVA